MIITVQAKTGSANNSVEKVNGEQYLVHTKEKAHENKANLSIIKILSDYLVVPKTSIKLVKGHKSKTKVFEIFS